MCLTLAVSAHYSLVFSFYAAFTDEHDWWSTTGKPAPAPKPSPRNCSAAPKTNMDANAATNVPGEPQNGYQAASVEACCGLCVKNMACSDYVFQPSTKNCLLVANADGYKKTLDRVVGTVGAQAPTRPAGPQFSDVDLDLYGFFHGLRFTDALEDYQRIGGKAIMVPKYAMGVWWSRWYDLNNYDTRKVVADYESRDIPLDVFVIDMDWHTKDDWSGFTFDPHLFPFPDDSMAYLNAKGLFVTLNLHDASGVNSWDAMFPQLIKELGQSTTHDGIASLFKMAPNIVIRDVFLHPSTLGCWAQNTSRIKN